MTDSLVERAIGRFLTICRQALASSLLIRSFQRLGQRTGEAVGRSNITRDVAVISSWIRGSWLYRWLTAEPDPEVIVIDLRDTYAVGPIIAVLDRVGPWMAREWEHAAVRGVLYRAAKSIRTAPIRITSLLVAALLVANLGFMLAFSAPSATAIGTRLVLLAPALLGTRVTASWEDLRTARAGRVLISLLEPPEPPGTSDDEGSDDEGSDDEGTDEGTK